MLEKSYRIASYDVTPDGLVRVSALQKYMQQLAREDCNGYGATYENMRNDNMVFVITKLGLEMYTDIHSEDVISIRTYNNRIEGVQFDREFEIFKNGKLAAAVSTYWVLLNFEKRTIVRPKLFKYSLISYNIKDIIIEVPRNIFDDKGNSIQAGIRKVVFSDLDENNHLNNCVYSDIALDYSPFDLSKYTIQKVLINFVHEARLGDELNILVIPGENSYCVNAHNITKDKPCFEAELTFYKK
jgi:medium-chain acyl-[acyl-carrier-protein] hydrolase